MPKMIQSMTVAAPREIVWDASIDFKGWEEISDVRIDQLTSGPFGVGTRWRETRQMLGRDSSQEWEVTSVDEPSRFTCVSQAMGATWQFDQFMVPDGDGTRVFTEFDITPEGVRSKAAFAVTWPAMSFMMRRGVAKDMAAFVDRCERRAQQARAKKA